jgi:hypothetical protein
MYMTPERRAVSGGGRNSRPRTPSGQFERALGDPDRNPSPRQRALGDHAVVDGYGDYNVEAGMGLGWRRNEDGAVRIGAGR